MYVGKKCYNLYVKCFEWFDWTRKVKSMVYLAYVQYG